MPNNEYAKKASEFLEACMKCQDSSGGLIECVVTGMPAGVGEPVFDKLDANLAKAVMSIGSVKGIEIGDGFAVSKMLGSENNDAFGRKELDQISKKTTNGKTTRNGKK